MSAERIELDPVMEIQEIDTDTLLNEVASLKNREYRLMQVCATKEGEDSYGIIYTFGKGYEMKHLRIHISSETEVASITNLYEVAYLYENEMHDLFGVNIGMINLDFHGGLFRTGKPTPFK